MDYLSLLENSYKQSRINGFTVSPETRLEYLAEAVFEYTTDETEVAEFLAKKALEVCLAITRRETFDYIKLPENNLWYLTLLNTPFFETKVSWGCSIRGAWWDTYPANNFTLNSCGFYIKEQQLEELIITLPDWDIFILALETFVSSDKDIKDNL